MKLVIIQNPKTKTIKVKEFGFSIDFINAINKWLDKRIKQGYKVIWQIETNIEVDK